jgi:cyclic beta-1,2-glucan synthetase
MEFHRQAKQGRKMEAILLGFFAQRDQARVALRTLQRRGFHRCALAHKAADGSVDTWDPFLARRAFWVTLAPVLLGSLVGALANGLSWAGPHLVGGPSPLIWFLGGGVVGGLLAGGWIARSKYGVRRRLLHDHARWLASDETVVIVQAPIGTLRLAVALLRESVEIPPVVFVLRPERKAPVVEVRTPGAPLSVGELEEYAQHLAADHRVDIGPRRSTELLKRLETARQWIHQVCADLSEASHLEQGAPPVAEWILDNEYLTEGNSRDVQLNLPRRFCLELPTLANEPARGLPRIFGLADELVSHTGLRLDRENILAFAGAYQSFHTLTIGELWAYPQMLRIALIESIEDLAASALTELREREIADFWANRLITVSRRDPSQLFAIMAELTQAQPAPSPYFAMQLVDNLYDEEGALVPVQSWLERTFHKPLADLNAREQNRQMRDQISIANAFTSLRQLSLLDWRRIFEDLSAVERMLRLDPAGVYSRMDFDTRDRYRRTIEELARGSGAAEDQVAKAVLDLAIQAADRGAKDERWVHVGTYLIGEGRGGLARLVHSRETARFQALQWVYRHHATVYFSALGFFSAVLLCLILLLGLRGESPGVQVLMALLLLIPVSQLALELVNYLVTRLLPARTLPKMDFATSGIPDAFRTLVVVPVLLVDAEEIRAEVEKLEIRYLANKEANLLFGLFTDYLDSEQPSHQEDRQLLQAATEGLEALNRRYGGERFFLFHRERTWCESEKRYIGWERKRGKLEELNRLIDGTRPEEAPRLVYVGTPARLSDVRFVITLDSDTQLPSGTARKMVQTLAHPLNQPRLDAQGRILPGTYTIIQPRVSPSLPSTSATLFSRLFADAVGIDPYTKAVSDVNQDLAGEGSYHGKGIYDVRAFSRVLSGRFPEGRLLSHDLIEGAHVRVGLASDIELQDEFPVDYRSYTRRQHRWIRGDWQIADWILPRVPQPGGRRGPNELSPFNRWKIFDNLRRSLFPVASMGLLLVSWLTSSPMAWISAIVVAFQLLFHPLAQPFTWATTRQGLKSFSLSQVVHDLLYAAAEAALLPHQAWLALDAIVRVWYRRLISHRGMLEWTSGQVVTWNAPGRLPVIVIPMSVASLLSGLVAWSIQRWMPSHLLLASPWLVLWFLSPLIGWALSLQPQVKREPVLLLEKDYHFLRKVARRTWRYFSDFVGEETSWLPPDNYQVSHRNQLAMRTSPTNIGLWMLSALAAHDFGYLTGDQVVEKLTHTLGTIGKLERYEGHLLNWYDTQTLAPLEPRYVSTVDSGNLLSALWCLVHGLEELIQGPVLDNTAFGGLLDTWEVLTQAMQKDGISVLGAHTLFERVRAWEAPPERTAAALRLLRSARGDVQALADAARESAGVEVGAGYWARQFEKQVSSWLLIADRYLSWIEILDEKAEDEIAQLGERALGAIRHALTRTPSLVDLAQGNIECIPILQSIRAEPSPAAAPLLEWLDRVLQAFSKSKWLAGETLAVGKRLIQDSRELSDSMNMRFLYDPERRLFSVGYNLAAARLDPAYYDLLASEARLGSFVAIAGGSIPIEHWFSMSRPYRALGRRRVLLSWNGSMFEYLMPEMLQRSYGNTLLERAAKEAVAVQIGYGRKRRTPWGISECAYGDLDIAKAYQYKAFGVPELGLKRGLEEEIVIAPYASLLALRLAPRETVQNLRRMAGLGLLDDYGFYESVDFGRQPRRGGERGVIVRTYMAHHQGMGLLSLGNFLHNNPFPRRFHADTRVRSVESLLHERIPVLPPFHHVSTRERMPSLASIGEVAPSVSKFDTPHTATPKTQLLGNGRYGLMVTNAGGGYSRWENLDLTRWRSDRTQDSWGTFCYVYEAESDRLWCNTYQPVGGKAEGHTAHFALDRAVFRRVDHGIQTETEVVVSPEEDVEIRRLTLTNRSLRTRHLNLTSYVELAMAPHAVDRKHAAFNKLFIQTEAVPQVQALLAHRRSRRKDDAPVFIAHRLTLEDTEEETLHFETDRRRFIGRGRTLANPMGARGDLGGSQGFVLDPILSLRRGVTLGPGRRVQLSLVVAAGETRQQALSLMAKFADPHAIDRAMDFAWASAQLELRLLHIQPDEARRFQELASHVLFPNPLLRPPAERLIENRKGQAGLWAYGISGDLPIALVTIAEAGDISLVRQVLQAHSYWRAHGLSADLVILNEEVSGYEQPLRERLEALIRAHSMHTGADQPGGVFLLGADQIPQEDLTLLVAAARVVLVAARGTLPQQLGVPVEIPELPEPLTKRRAPREPSAPLPFMELPYFNSLGGFTPDGREYAIYLGPNTHTPAPWVNVIAAPTFGTVVSETGSGFTWFGNSQRNRLTQWSNDPVADPPSEALYIRDEETGSFWTPTASPVREGTAYRARHGAGYSVFEHNSHGIEQELTLFVPVDQDGNEPIKLQRLRLKNDTSRRRKLSVTYYVEWTLGEIREDSQMHVVTRWDNDVRAVMARNYYHPEYGNRVAFAAMSPPPQTYSGDRASFLGRNRTPENPAAMERIGLSRRTGAGLDPCAALQVTIEIEPGESTDIVCMLGQEGTEEEVRKRVLAYRNGLALETALSQSKAWWDELLGAIEVHTPELAVDFMVNRWLLYQSLSCRIWGRTAFYQSGGAFGFRDQLQDVMALIYTKPELALEHILRAASRQFAEGDVQHWWHPPNGAGVRSRISDDLLWLPYVTAQYVRITGDVDVLHREVSFLSAPMLETDQSDSFMIPEVNRERATLFEHCQRAVARGLTSGPHGLPLMGTGDWNDALDLVGAEGKGESIWLAWFLVDVLEDMAELSDLLGQREAGRAYLEKRDVLIEHTERSAWDGQWYLRGTFDDGTPLGSSGNPEARIDSLPQSWAWLTGAARPHRAEMALDSAWAHLVREDQDLVLLFEPPFDISEPSPGYIRGYPPGVRENGGQYTHAAVWLAMALARRGDGTRAAKVLRILNPIERTRDSDSVWRYGIEPYVVAADVYRLHGRIGQGGWSWYTGAAAWMYRAWVEEILGLKVRGQTLRMDPVIPASWEGFRLLYRHGEAVYEIQVENPDRCERGVLWVEMDGRRMTDGVIALERSLVKHRVLVHMGQG